MNVIKQPEFDNPWYVNLLETILKTSGPIAVVALVLVWYLMTSISTGLRNVTLAVETNHIEIQAAKVTMHEFVAKQNEIDTVKVRQNDLILKIMRQVCINGATTEVARAGCLQ
jgi:hypothetical protein